MESLEETPQLSAKTKAKKEAIWKKSGILMPILSVLKNLEQDEEKRVKTKREDGCRYHHERFLFSLFS